MIAVPTSSPATTIRTRDFRRPMFLAARRARSVRNPMTTATRATPMTIAHADASGRDILPPTRLLDDLAVPHPQVSLGPGADAGDMGHDVYRRVLCSLTASSV